MPSETPASREGATSVRPVRRRSRLPYYLLLILAAGVVPLLRWINARIPHPAALGVEQGRLAACPDSPNCVSSQAEAAGARVEPLRFSGGPDVIPGRIKAAVGGLRGATLVGEGPGYLRYEFKSPLWGFVDDVEFLVAPKEGVVHLRSASRVGYSDLGANRRRIEAIRGEWLRIAPAG